MKKQLTSIILLLSTFAVQAQQLEFVNARKINLNEERLSKQEIYQLFENHPKSQQLYKSGKTLRTVGDVTFFGGFAIATTGFLIDTFREDDTPLNPHDDSNLTGPSLIIGGAMMIATIPLKIIGKNKIRKSVEAYNQSIDLSAVPDNKPALSLIMNGHEVGLRLSF